MLVLDVFHGKTFKKGLTFGTCFGIIDIWLIEGSVFGRPWRIPTAYKDLGVHLSKLVRQQVIMPS